MSANSQSREGRADLNIQIFGPDVMTNPPHDLKLLFGSVHIDFLKQAHYPGFVEIATAVNWIGNSSWGVVQAGFQEGDGFGITEAAMVRIKTLCGVRQFAHVTNKQSG